MSICTYCMFEAPFCCVNESLNQQRPPNNNIECERREFGGDRHGVDKDFSFLFIPFLSFLGYQHAFSFLYDPLLTHTLQLSIFFPIYFLMRSLTCHPLHFICTRESPFSFFICVAKKILVIILVGLGFNDGVSLAGCELFFWI